MSVWHSTPVPHFCVGRHTNCVVAQERRKLHTEPRFPKRFGGGSGFVAAASSFVKFAGTSALDAVGDEGSDDHKGSESENAQDTSYGAGIGKESKMKIG